MKTIIITKTQNENNNEAMVHHINENTSEYTTPESTTSALDISQAGTATNNHLVRVPTRVVSPRQNTYDPQSYSDTSPRRNITFNFSSNSDDEIQDETQNITSFRNTSVNVSSPRRTVLDNTQNINTAQNTTRSMYDPPSLPSIFKNPNRTIRPENNNNQQTSSRYYDPFNYSFYPQSNTNIQTNDNQNPFQSNNKPNLSTYHSFPQPLLTNSTQTNSFSQNQRIPYSNIVQSSQRRFQNPPLSHISTDPLYQMNQHTTSNPTQISPTVNMAQSVAPPPQYIPVQDTFIKTSASKPEPKKPFDGLDHSYTPEEYLQQVEARLTFAIGEEPQNNPVKYRSRHNRRMTYIQCSLIGTALDWYTNLHISYEQQWNSFVQLFKKQFSQKTAYYAHVEAMSFMKKDNETVRHFALRVQQLVKKGWCNENAATINLKSKEIFTKGLAKKFCTQKTS